MEPWGVLGGPWGALGAPLGPPGGPYLLKTYIFPTFFDDFQGGLGGSLGVQGEPRGVLGGPLGALWDPKRGEGEFTIGQGEVEERSRRGQGEVGEAHLAPRRP